MRILLISISIICTAFLANGQPLETVVQRGHNASIKAVKFTPDGNYLITGSRDKTAKLWELKTGRELRTFFGHSSTINDIAISPDGKFMLTSSADQTAKLWEITTGSLIKSFEGHGELLTAVDFHPSGKQIITAGYDNEAILWDIQTGEEIKKFEVNPDKGLGYGVNASFSPDGNHVAFGNDNRTATLYDLNSNQTKEFKPAEGWCGGCATFVKFSPDGKSLLKGSNKAPLELINLTNGEITTVFEENWEEFTAIDMSKNQVLLTGEDSLKVFSRNGKLQYALVRNSDLPITDACFSPDGESIALSSDDQSVTILNSATGKVIKTISGYLRKTDKAGLDYDPNSRWDYYIKKYTDLKNEFDISPDGKYLVTGKIGSIARMWEVETGVIMQEFRGHEKAVLCMAFSEDGNLLVTGSADNTIKLWDATSGKEIRTFEGHRELVFTVRFSKDQKQIISGSWDGTVRIWDVETGQQSQYLRLEEGSSYDTHFFRNDIYAITAGLDKTLRLWEMDSQQEVKKFIGHTDIIHSIAVHPYAPQMISAGWDGKLKGWDITTGLQTFKSDLHDGAVYATAYNSQGNLIASGGAHRSIKIYNSEGQFQYELAGHTGAITSLKFTNNSSRLVSSSDNGEMKIWDLNDKTELISYLMLDETNWMAINAEGFFNATDGAIKSIAFVKGMESYGAEQFFDQYFQPDLLNKTFLEDNKNLNMNEKIEKYPPPKVTIIAPHENETVRSENLELIAKAENAGGGIEKVKVLHNGKTVLLENAKDPERTAINVTLSLVPGKNEIAVSAFSNGGIESTKQITTITMEGKVNSTLYLFAVGINKYKNEALNLNYAAADAESFVSTLKNGASKLFDRTEVIKLYDTEATRDQILNTLSTMSRVIQPQDVLVFYYAGHGSMVDNNFYFIPTENVRLYSADKLKKNAIYAGELQEKLKAISALKQLVIIDACQSGGSVELLASRGAAEEKALAQLSRSTGIHVLAAAGSEQFATEFEELGHGLFTYVLLEGLAGKADGAPKDGKITIYELKSFIDDQMPEFSRKYKGKMQFPYTFSRGHDFPIVIN